MCEERKNGAECIKYKDLMSEYHRTKSLLKGIMIVFKTKGRKIVAFLTGALGCLDVNRAAKKHAG